METKFFIAKRVDWISIPKNDIIFINTFDTAHPKKEDALNELKNRFNYFLNEGRVKELSYNDEVFNYRDQYFTKDTNTYEDVLVTEYIVELTKDQWMNISVLDLLGN